MKHIQTFESFLYEGQLNETKKTWTVVSQDTVTKKWGIEGDFDADDEDDAVTIGKAQAIKHGMKRNIFYAFPEDSKELNDFIDDNDFID